MSEVQRTTGYAPDLFDAHETSSANVKDKDAKVAYLTKIIACVAIDSGEQNPIAEATLKIVAGLEPERTNAFLQALATCAAKGGPRARRRAAREARRDRRGEKQKRRLKTRSGVRRASRGPAGPEPAGGGLRSHNLVRSVRGRDRCASRRRGGGGFDASLAESRRRRSVEKREKSRRSDASAERGRPPPRPKPEPPISPVSAAPTNDALKPDGEKQTNGAKAGGAILGEDDASDSSDDDAIVGDGLEGLDEDAGANPWSAAREPPGVRAPRKRAARWCATCSRRSARATRRCARAPRNRRGWR